MMEHLWRAHLPRVGSNFMAIAETEGGGAIYVWLHRLLGELTGVEAHPPALMVDN